MVSESNKDLVFGLLEKQRLSGRAETIAALLASGDERVRNIPPGELKKIQDDWKAAHPPELAAQERTKANDTLTALDSAMADLVGQAQPVKGHEAPKARKKTARAPTAKAPASRKKADASKPASRKAKDQSAPTPAPEAAQAVTESPARSPAKTRRPSRAPVAEPPAPATSPEPTNIPPSPAATVPSAPQSRSTAPSPDIATLEQQLTEARQQLLEANIALRLTREERDWLREALKAAVGH